MADGVDVKGTIDPGTPMQIYCWYLIMRRNERLGIYIDHFRMDTLKGHWRIVAGCIILDEKVLPYRYIIETDGMKKCPE